MWTCINNYVLNMLNLAYEFCLIKYLNIRLQIVGMRVSGKFRTFCRV